MTQPLIILITGAAAFGLAALLWALRISDGARGASRKYREETQAMREKLARAESVFGAHPGVIMVWEDAEPRNAATQKSALAPSDWAAPNLYGSPVALMGLLRFTDDASSDNPAARILEGLADLEARDGAGQDTTLRERLKQLRAEGAPFSLTIIGPSGRFLEADGRTAGARAVLWVTDTTIKGLEESGARARFEEARAAVARDPMAFLEMLGRAPFPAWRMSGAGKLQWVNTAYLKAVGASTMDQVLDRQIMLDQQVTAQAQKTVQGNAETDDTRHVVAAGERRAMRVKMFPLSGGIGGMAFDITDQENARETLDKHVKAHDETLNHVADSVAIFGADRKLIFNNRAFAEMWGLDPAYLLEKPDHGSLLDRLRERRKLPARPDYARWRSGELAYYQGEKNEVLEDLWNIPDGRIVKVTRQRHPLGGLLMIFKDLTDELALRTEYNALINVQKATLDHLREAVVVFDAAGRLRLHNEAFATLWGLEGKLADSPDFDVVVDACSRLFHDRNVWANIKSRVTNPSPEYRQQDQGVMRTSSDRTLTWITQPLPNGATLIAFMDVTADRKVEAALKDRAEAFQAADRLKTEFVQNVSYQLRSPLTTILGYAELLESGRPGALTDKQREQVIAILSASDHLSKLIGNILDLAMIEAGRMELDLSDVSLRKTIEESVDLVVSTAANTKVRVEILCDARVGTIHADERRIKQILFNLLTNALRFTGPGGHVKVEARKVDGVVQLSVTDNGKGISQERQASAFDSFTSSDNRGAGLGLALVRSFVELHGGWVAMKSAPGAGAAVMCFLPETASPKALRAELELGPGAVAAA
ncbi:MAG: ATP-binding protein, partial [Alphaproteobacteria bacterium]|nr:ATP-binding protein [Alphaproteobacteria bacterium]